MPYAQVVEVTANGTYEIRRDSDNSSSAGITLGATISGPGAVAATVVWSHSNDREGWDDIATQTLSGTLTDNTLGNAQTFTPWLRAVVTGFTGTMLKLSVGE